MTYRPFNLFPRPRSQIQKTFLVSGKGKPWRWLPLPRSPESSHWKESTHSLETLAAKFCGREDSGSLPFCRERSRYACRSRRNAHTGNRSIPLQTSCELAEPLHHPAGNRMFFSLHELPALEREVPIEIRFPFIPIRYGDAGLEKGYACLVPLKLRD